MPTIDIDTLDEQTQDNLDSHEGNASKPTSADSLGVECRLQALEHESVLAAGMGLFAMESEGKACEEPDAILPSKATEEKDVLAYADKKDWLGEVLYDFLRGLDHKGNGHLTHDELQEALEIVRLHQQSGRVSPDGEIDYAHLSRRPAGLSKWDLDGDGRISLNEVLAASKHHLALQKSNRRYRYVIPLLALGLILSCVVTFVMSFAAAEMTKEIKTGTGGAILTTDGSPARIASAEMEVNSDGTLVALGDRDVPGSNASTKPLAIRLAETSRRLSSTIPDKMFNEMSKLTIDGVDGVSHMTMAILGFTRVLTPSRCGSLVHLDTKHGTVVLDDTILHFDKSLSERALALGIELEGLSEHGRRLASGAEVAGIFSFFEDYDWQCVSIPVPQSPAAPYVIKTVKRVPCPPTSQCSSYMGGGIMYPGYEAKTNSVIVAETLAETEDFSLSIQRYPNHPFQSLVTLTDHESQISRTMHIFNGSAQHCVSRNYADAVGNTTDSLSSYFAAYLGHETRPAEEFNLPWGNVTIPKKNVRAFRLQPREGVDGALPVPIDYDDDATTLLPTRLFFNGAEQMQLDVQEILVETIQQDAQEVALDLRRSVDFICESIAHDSTPAMLSAVTENEDDVDFYAKLYDSSTGNLTSSYWIKAVEEEDAENLQEGGGGRRLLSKRSSRNLGGISLNGGFEINLPPAAKIYAQQVANCLTVRAETQL